MANEKLVNRENLKSFRQKYDERLKNGEVIPSKSLVAKELETISPESGDTQETPFVLQGTGTANGTSSVDTGTIGKHIQKQGSVYCVNQLQQPSTTSSTTNDLTRSYDDTTKKITISGTASADTIISLTNVAISVISGHNYLLKACPSGGSDTTYYSDISYNSTYKDYGNGVIVNVSANNSVYIRIYVKNATAMGSKSFYTQLIDLTQWFNGNIPQDLLDHPEHWSWYQTYGDYIPYNTGTLVSGNGKYLVCGGRNVWNEEWESGAISTTTGLNTIDNNRIRSKNYISVIPSLKYYIYSGTNSELQVLYYDSNKNYISYETKINTYFTTPSNCKYLRFRIGGSTYPMTTYNHDITISLYYAGEDYSQYYPYEQPKVYDTGTETLLSTGVKLSVSGEREDIYDYKEPSGLITRRVGVVDLGTLNYTFDDYRFYTSDLVDLIKKEQGTLNLVCDRFIAISSLSPMTATNQTMFLSSAGNLSLSAGSYTSGSSFANALSGVYLYYELATTTTEQGTPFSENIEINDFGTMGWYATYTDSNTNALVSIPQGCKIFYPAWYVGFIDTLGQRADIDWNANNVVSQSELSQYVKQEDKSSEYTDSAGLTYNIVKIYKMGNIVSVTMRVYNNTGSTINAFTQLMTLGSSISPSMTIYLHCNINETTIASLSITNAGVVKCNTAITNGQYATICFTYAVA